MALDNCAQRQLCNDHPGLPNLVLRDFTSVVEKEEDNLTELKAKTEELIRNFARASDSLARKICLYQFYKYPGRGFVKK